MSSSVGDPALGQCVCCGSSFGKVEITSRDIRHGLAGEFQVVVCGRCGLARTEPPVEDPAVWYPDDYQNHSERLGFADRVSLALLRRTLVRSSFGRGAISYLLAATDFGGFVDPGAAVLDVGAGSGHVVAALQARGIDAWGIEPSVRAVQVAQADGLHTIREGVLDTATLDASEDLRSRRWDIIRFYHTLEHVADPLGTLMLARTLLSPTGRVVVGVPNFGGLGRRAFKKDWDGLELPRHVHHFSRDSLRSVFTKAGLRVTSARTVAIPGVLVGSLAALNRGGQPRRAWLTSSLMQAALLPFEIAAALAGAGEGLLFIGVADESRP